MSPRPAASEPAGQEQQARLEALHARLLDAVAQLTSADGWQQMLRTAAALPTYSPHNILLITTQRPDATAVAGFNTWKQVGRAVRKGEKGIAILAPVLRRSSQSALERGTPADSPAAPSPDGTPSQAPDGGEAGSVARRLSGFRIVHVFDISQTDGPDLPAPPEAVRLEGDAPTGLIDGLSEQIIGEGYQLIRHHFDVPHPGLERANGVTDYFAKTVLIRPGLSDAQASKTLAHELGHVLLHAPGSRPAGLTREQAEVEAESVAYVVTSAHGLDSSSYTVPYVAGWAGTDPALVARSAERVLTTARTVLTRTPPPPSDLVTPELRERLLTRTREPAPPGERARHRDAVAALAERSPLLSHRQLTAPELPGAPHLPGASGPLGTNGGRGAQEGLW
ncbi:MAG: ArdC-like ssDNA-binding domain-containing protein [Mycobacteriales bacterium]|nr:ArdC-like ssDNA-binding domain-containing protein [Mycobacteriales bacterium]